MAREGGASIILYVALILSIIFLIGSIGAVIVMNSEVDKLKGDIVKAKSATKREKAKAEKLREQVAEAEKLVNGGSGPVTFKQYQKTILKDARTTLQSILSGEWVTKEDIDLIKDERIKTTWDKLLSFKNEQKEYDNLNDLYQDLVLQLKAVIHLIPRLRAQRVMKIEEFVAATTKFEQDRTDFIKQLEEVQENLQKEQDKALEDARRFDQEKRRLTDQIDELNKKRNRSEKVNLLKVAKLESQKNTLKSRIQEIVKRQKKSFEGSGADGEVIYSEPDLGYAWIDLGKKHNLRAGMSFQVFRYIKGGRKRLKGKIIVKAVEADMAKVTIVEGARLKDPVTKKILVLPLRDDPIVKGDLIRTPLFDRNEQQVFVFLGDKPTNTIYKKKELERKIEEAGGKVDKEVSIATDFVILLGGAEDEERDPIDKAGQFGCIFMRESELLEYLSR
jgi:hypothetical protein